MGWGSKIEWTHATFNPWWGCTERAAECEHCYAREYARSPRGLRITGGKEVWNADKQATRHYFGTKHWREPLTWHRRALDRGERYRIFAGSMCDVFESTNTFTDEERFRLDYAKAQLWALIEATPNLDWLLLTKCPTRIATPDGVPSSWIDGAWPSNAWLGVTVGNQAGLKRLTMALEFRDLVPRVFVSHEPAIGPVNWGSPRGRLSKVDWLITGGETGPKAWPMHPAWIAAARNAALAAGTRWMFKQWGDWTEHPQGTHWLAPDGRYEPRFGRPAQTVYPDVDPATVVKVRKVGKKSAGRMFEGQTWDQVPEAA
jgi:protein gp37